MIMKLANATLCLTRTDKVQSETAFEPNVFKGMHGLPGSTSDKEDRFESWV